MRTLGGALGGQISATFIVDNTVHGLPTVTGFTATFVMAAIFLLVAALAAGFVPTMRPGRARERVRGGVPSTQEAG
jgi:hypothetical protein